MYLRKKDNGLATNYIQTSIENAGFYFGHVWARKVFRKLPGENEFVSYNKGFFINANLGLTKVSLSEEEGNIWLPNDTLAAPPVSMLALSYGLSVGYTYRDFSLSFMLGVDSPFDQEKSNYWVFSNLPWLGVGIGYDL